MKRFWDVRTNLTLLVAAGAIAGGPAEAAEPTAPAEGHGGPSVDLHESFHVEQGQGHDISHAPATVFTADGQRMIVATSDKRIVVFDAATRAVLSEHELRDEATDAVAVDREGRIAVWVLAGGGLVVLDIDSGKIKVRDDKAGAKWVAVDPQGKRVAVSRKNAIEIRRVEDLSVERTLNGHEAQITNLAWSHGGRMLGATAQDGRIVVADLASGEILYQTSKPGALYALDFHPQGKALAFGGHERKVYEVDLGTKQETVLTGQQPFWITCVGYSPDGMMIALGDESCDIWLYDRRKPGQSVFHNKHHVECWLSQVAWARDNQTFLFGCRPNSHAGKPALHMPLNQVEAARSPAVRKTRQVLLDNVEQELTRTTDEPARQALVRLQEVLGGEENIHAQRWANAVGQQQSVPAAQFIGGDQMANQVNGVPVPPPGQSDTLGENEKLLPKRIQDLLASHRQTQQQVQEALQEDFTINQWRVGKQ